MYALRSTGQALVWMTLMLPVFVSLAGLVIDGGVLLYSHRQLQSLADGAARAGATRLDQARLRDSGGADVELDRSTAADTARTYVFDALAGSSPVWQQSPITMVDVGSRRVQVVVRATVSTAFLRVVHVDAVPVEVRAIADVQYGIRNGGGN